MLLSFLISNSRYVAFCHFVFLFLSACVLFILRQALLKKNETNICILLDYS